MGCLFELLFEVIFELFFEGLFETIGFFYLKLTRLFFPKKTLSKKEEATIKFVAKLFILFLMIAFIVGIILIFEKDPAIKNIGKYTVYISLAVMVVQLALGIILKIIEHYKK